MSLCLPLSLLPSLPSYCLKVPASFSSGRDDARNCFKCGTLMYPLISIINCVRLFFLHLVNQSLPSLFPAFHSEFSKLSFHSGNRRGENTARSRMCPKSPLREYLHWSKEDLRDRRGQAWQHTSGNPSSWEAEVSRRMETPRPTSASYEALP